MTIPDHLPLEVLMAEDGMCISAGLPESVRRELDPLVARVAEIKARIRESQKELEEAERVYEARRAALIPGVAP